MSIVENIRWLCHQQHTSIPKLEKELGFGNGAIYNWDKNSPTLGKLQQVAERLNVSVDFLVSGFDRDIIELVKGVAKTDKEGNSYFPNFFHNILDVELTLWADSFKHLKYIPVSLNPESIIAEIRYNSSLTTKYKKELLDILNIAKIKYEETSNNSSKKTLTPREENDITKGLERMLANLDSDNGIAYLGGEPMDEEARELMKISLENSMRMAKQLAKKKFTQRK